MIASRLLANCIRRERHTYVASVQLWSRRVVCVA